MFQKNQGADRCGRGSPSELRQVESERRVRRTAGLTALQEPLDQKLLRCDYSDVALLGKARDARRPRLASGRTRDPHPNETLFRLAFHEVRRILPMAPRKLAVGTTIAQHVVLYPLCYFVDRYHPARGEPGIPRLLTDPRAFVQATWRHALFGVVLGRVD